MVATAQEVHESVSSKSVRHCVWQRIIKILARLAPDVQETVLKTNLLCGLFAANQLAIEEDVDRVIEAWERVNDGLRLPGRQERSQAA
jgi:hypothetical protein